MRNPIETTRFANSSSPLSSWNVEQANGGSIPTKLLISVRDTEEATMVRDAGADWIDLKEPLAGSLGRPRLTIAAAVSEVLKGHALRSAALGELWELNDEVAFDFALHFPVLKVGLSRVGSDSTNTSENKSCNNWRNRFELLAAQLRMRGAELIPVAYADWSICGAPSVQDVQEVARQINASHMLIDTYVKDGRGLLDWLNFSELELVIEAGRQFHCGTVLAGSLRLDDAVRLLPLTPAALAVRGAVCQTALPTSTTDFQDRTTPIDPNRVATWKKCIGDFRHN